MRWCVCEWQHPLGLPSTTCGCYVRVPRCWLRQFKVGGLAIRQKFQVMRLKVWCQRCWGFLGRAPRLLPSRHCPTCFTCCPCFAPHLLGKRVRFYFRSEEQTPELHSQIHLV